MELMTLQNQQNPFPGSDPDRYEIWDMLVRRDIEAFVTADWMLVADDFAPDEFFGIDGNKAHNPDAWSLGFPDLETYKTEWLRQAQEFQKTEFAEDARAAIFRATRLLTVEIKGERAIAYKKFNGVIEKTGGEQDVLKWQTLYFCARRDGRWKITGFAGYLPNPMGLAEVS